MKVSIDTEISADVAETWARIDAALGTDDARRTLVKMSLAVFNAAQDAYNAAFRGKEDHSGLGLAGAVASRYHVLFEYIRDDLMGGATVNDAIEKLAAVSGLLEKMGWHGMPSLAFVGMQEIPLNRDMGGIHNDMMAYRNDALYPSSDEEECA